MSRWKPARIMLIAPRRRPCRARPRAWACPRGWRHREVGAGAEVPLARAGEHDRAHVEVAVRVAEVLDEAVAHVVRDRVALVGAVDREPEHAVLELGVEQLFGRSRLRHGFSSLASPPMHPGRPRHAGRTTNGLMSSSRTSSARSSARRCTFMIVSTSASTSAGFAPRTPSSSLKPLQLVQRAPRFVRVERRHAERHVAEHLDEDAAEPDRDDRAEELVVRDADERLDAAGHHLAHQHAFDAGLVGRPSRPWRSRSSYAARTSFGRRDADLARARRRSCAAGRATRPSSRPGSRSPSRPRTASAADVHSSSSLES